MTTPISNLTATWSNASVTYNAVSMDVNVSSYAANSKIINLKANANSVFSVDVGGNVAATSFIGSGALLTGISSAGRLVRITSYTSGNNIWTKPSDVTKVMVIVTGAGGGGYSVDLGVEPSGGSAGGTAIKYIDVTNISSAYCNVGSGGAVNSNGNDSQWYDGTNTLVGVKGLGTASSAGKLGGAATGGDINITGGSGGAGRAFGTTASAHGNAGASYWGGAGAYGSGGNPGSYNVQITGTGGIIVIFEYS